MKSNKLIALYISSRPKHWVKNILVFIAPILSLSINFDIFIRSFLSFICFCLVSSAIYLVNDSLDVKQDKLHPKKKYRPIASGLISTKLAKISSFLFLIVSFIISIFISNYLFFILLIYVIIQFLYCLRLKNKVLVDLFCISSGFLLRTIAGSYASDIYLSPWFLLTIGMLSFFLAVEKRKSELIQYSENGKLTRKVLSDYSMPLLVQMESLSATSVFISYSLWAFGPALKGAPTSNMLFTIPFVLFGILRYQFLSNYNKLKGDRKNNLKLNSQYPEEILFKDKEIKLTIALWLVFSILIIFYF